MSLFTLLLLLRVLARPYLVMLYVIFPIHMTFPIMSRCVSKATIHRKKNSELLSVTWESFFWKLLWYCICMLYLINYSILSQSLPIFHVSLSIIYQLFSPYHTLYTSFLLSISKGFSLYQFSFNILNIWKNLLFFLINEKMVNF